MFTDWAQALAAESLPLNSSPDDQSAAAARVTARSARDKDDLVLLLDAIGLPTDEDTLTALLPHLPSPSDTGTTGEHSMPQQNLTAHEATALSMYYADAPAVEITQTTGVTDDELTAPVAAQEREFANVDAPQGAEPVKPEPAINDLEQLLAWAETHPAANVRNKAARIRGDLAELTERRAVDDAQCQAEQRVAEAKAELEAAQKALRDVKTGRLTATASPVKTPAEPQHSKRERAAIRDWARANGYKAADQGAISKKVQDAYAAAHTGRLAEAS